jgi:arginine-tRNA-protein transferase
MLERIQYHDSMALISDPALARYTAILPDGTLACPYLDGQEERKVFTHLVGERAGETQ